MAESLFLRQFHDIVKHMQKVKSTRKRVLRRTHAQKNIKQIRFRQSLFWDVDPKTIDPKKHARYIIERVLDFGTGEEIRWLFAHYSRGRIKKIMNLPRSPVHEKSKSLWSLLQKQ
ncbi:MAG: hypothetical protein A3H69_01710 [Candidatus Sungbacteria bacterium RIFCSPLOWO2_02_FULL_47_9]|uniref:DUF6922 domain-containing protein n=1 Tax=Candidatus Sungbacteria bacterium RIFCSPHIGHO2_01_FULL_47_32 TaxID=1802264 RepID=A0A1G2K3Q5_9BACT|nr:MAG: hypothetical protein A2633_00020 [Candidatus Sungbacteria bacterium RIFCSPHIGHO2_01_FULL_47_32]OGZ99108.1 MAG: hypothetical protein A3D57_00735 [Candidatus Sungbacteria bacterium RIFCSPHIGHO2_02_FULL_46_12]OHA04626.1 MAG: hypothetical protein A3A28_00630 [Candidatus Sungbacteria bacterium RIFCSPLOWO2_01_FULL_47_32]OHA09428.1 MAG: hypothetical protein A3H69_01710 [Candidatus Sungbacteria bacterium RIFCSPLOWO2_02_FULL_47_9]